MTSHINLKDNIFGLNTNYLIKDESKSINIHYFIYIHICVCVLIEDEENKFSPIQRPQIYRKKLLRLHIFKIFIINTY